MLPPRWRSKEITEPGWGYMAEIYKIIYLTNMIKGLNRPFRQITKNKLSFIMLILRSVCCAWHPCILRSIGTPGVRIWTWCEAS